MQTVTLNLPESLMQRAQAAAKTLRRPLENVLADMLDATLPDFAEAPLDMQSELLGMSFLTEQELWQAAQSQLAETQQAALQAIHETELARPLTLEEQEQKESLIAEYDRALLRKARAYALLTARSGRLLLAESEQN
jgi:hypothetical protein